MQLVQNTVAGRLAHIEGLYNAAQEQYGQDCLDRLIQEDDPRYRVPSLKTELAERQIPIAADLVPIIDHYVDEHRGRRDTPFMFVSNQGKPLAANSVNIAFQTITGALSEEAKKSFEDYGRSPQITPHDLRHTCAVARLSEFINGGTGMKVALQNLRAFFGWTASSDMPTYYSQAYFEDRLRTEWRGKFNDRVGILRQLQEIEGRSGLTGPDANR